MSICSKLAFVCSCHLRRRFWFFNQYLFMLLTFLFNFLSLYLLLSYWFRPVSPCSTFRFIVIIGKFSKYLINLKKILVFGYLIWLVSLPLINHFHLITATISLNILQFLFNFNIKLKIWAVFHSFISNSMKFVHFNKTVRFVIIFKN